MPVDHPTPLAAPIRRMPMRTLNLALGFLLTLGLLMVLHSAVGFGASLS